MIRSKNALRHGNCAQQRRFFEAIYPHKGVRVVVGCNESSFMFFAELQTSGVSRTQLDSSNRSSAWYVLARLLCAMRTFSSGAPTRRIVANSASLVNASS